jgi:hypothetical protein
VGGRRVRSEGDMPLQGLEQSVLTQGLKMCLLGSQDLRCRRVTRPKLGPGSRIRGCLPVAPASNSGAPRCLTRQVCRGLCHARRNQQGKIDEVECVVAVALAAPAEVRVNPVL